MLKKNQLIKSGCLNSHNIYFCLEMRKIFLSKHSLSIGLLAIAEKYVFVCLRVCGVCVCSIYIQYALNLLIIQDWQ